MKTNGNAEKILNKAQNQLQDAYMRIQERIEKNYEDTGPFIQRLIDWVSDDSHIMAYTMFHEAISVENPLNFFESLNSFVGNCLLDDRAFRIEWHKVFYDENFELVWDNAGEFKTVVTTKEDPESRPVVLRYNGDENRCHRALLLMEAMDILEAREKQRTKEIEEDMASFNSFCDKLKG